MAIKVAEDDPQHAIAAAAAEIIVNVHRVGEWSSSIDGLAIFSSIPPPPAQFAGILDEDGRVLELLGGGATAASAFSAFASGRPTPPLESKCPVVYGRASA